MPLDSRQHTLNPEHVKRAMDITNRGPFFQEMGLTITEMGAGFCKAEVNIVPKLYNSFGNVHGGVYAAFIDSISYYAMYCDIPEGYGAVTLDLSIDDVHGVSEGLVTIEGSVIKLGSTICIAEAEAHDEQGRLLVCGRSKQLLREGLQTIDQAAALLGEDPLPPKFLD